MAYRVLSLAALALVVGFLAGTPARSEDKNKKDTYHEGTIVSCTGNKFTMKMKGTNEEMTHTLASDAVIMIDGRKAEVSTFRDLKADTKVRVWTKKGDKDTVVKIEALDKNKDFEKGTDRDRKDDK